VATHAQRTLIIMKFVSAAVLIASTTVGIFCPRQLNSTQLSIPGACWFTAMLYFPTRDKTDR